MQSAPPVIAPEKDVNELPRMTNHPVRNSCTLQATFVEK